MNSRGVTVPEEMPLHFSEIGIGGCTEKGRLTSSPAVAAQTLWEGSDQLSRNPWATPQMQKLRLTYHQALLGFLKKQPSSHRITKAFLWNEGSWDVMGVTAPGFQNEEINTLIQLHNASLLPK